MTAGHPPYVQQPQRNNAMAIVSLASGIAGVTIVPLVGSIAALLCGYKARRQLAAAPGRERGEGFATAGIVLGWVGTILAIIGLIVFLAFFAFVSDQVGDVKEEIQKQERQFDRDVRQPNETFERKALEDEKKFDREAARDQREFERRARAMQEEFERRARENRQQLQRSAPLPVPPQP